MKEKILNEIKKDYSQRLKVKEKMIEKFDRIRELEENKYVREYLELTKEMSSNNYNWYAHTTDQQLLDISFKIYARDIKESNRLYIYLGSYKSDQGYCISYSYNDILVERDSPEALYSIYKDLENDNEIKISVDIRDEFEQTHKIIYPENVFINSEFYELRYKFLKLSIEEGQDIACKKLLKKN